MVWKNPTFENFRGPDPGIKKSETRVGGISFGNIKFVPFEDVALMKLFRDLVVHKEHSFSISIKLICILKLRCLKK